MRGRELCAPKLNGAVSSLQLLWSISRPHEERRFRMRWFSCTVTDDLLAAFAFGSRMNTSESHY